MEGFSFLLGYNDEMAWTDWLTVLERNRVGVDLPSDMVRQALLAAEVDGALVGRVSIRFALNAWLARKAGHIGYGVPESFRHTGYAPRFFAKLSYLRVAKASTHCSWCAPRTTLDRPLSSNNAEVCSKVQPKRKTDVPSAGTGSDNDLRSEVRVESHDKNGRVVPGTGGKSVKVRALRRGSERPSPRPGSTPLANRHNPVGRRGLCRQAW
jgi:hypothetical protein